MSIVKSSHITVAVLPFRNLSTQDMAIFESGFTEDLITDLSRFTGLSVISRHSTKNFTYDAGKKGIEELNADYLIEGSFRVIDDKIRITIQLIRKEDQSVVFAGRHEENFDALLQVQSDVTQQIVNVLQQQINTNIVAGGYLKPKTKLAAYDYWLRGMHELKAGTPEHDVIARKYFNQALAVDASYARAYTGLSLSYFNEWSCQLWSRWEVSKNGAKEYAQKAIEIDENEYLSLSVLGRTCIYEGAYEQAENHLRKSLRLNPGDADNLVQIASCFAYLGYAEEAETLYNKALFLNPFNPDWYYTTGLLIQVELGNFEKAIEIGNKVGARAIWVDFNAYLAAAHYLCGREEKMKEFWQKYLDEFAAKIARKKDFDEKEAVTWFIEVNPYRDKTRLKPFWRYLKSHYELTGTIVESEPNPAEEYYFLSQGDLWQITYRGKSFSMPDLKGLHDISRLIAEPGKSFHCAELMGAAIEDGNQPLLLDDKARKEYQEKIRLLQEEIRIAEDSNDFERAGTLTEEYEYLLNHLSAALGISGRTRKSGSSVEKARSAVTWRIRKAIQKIEVYHPQLSKHFEKSIRTGTLSVYDPEQTIHWETRTDMV